MLCLNVSAPIVRRHRAILSADQGQVARRSTSGRPGGGRDAEDAEAVAELGVRALDDILERVDTFLDRARAALRSAPKEAAAPFTEAAAAAPHRWCQPHCTSILPFLAAGMHFCGLMPLHACAGKAGPE